MRGGGKPGAAISGRQLRIRRGLSRVPAGGGGLAQPRWGLAMTNLGVLSSRVIARRAQARRGNLKQAVTNPPEAFLCSGRCCEIATAPLGPRNDKSGSIAPLNSCHQYCQPAWRSLSAATDAIGAYHFIGSHYESAASRRARLSAPLQHYIALQKGRTCSPALLYYYFIFIQPRI